MLRIILFLCFLIYLADGGVIWKRQNYASVRDGIDDRSSLIGSKLINTSSSAYISTGNIKKRFAEGNSHEISNSNSYNRKTYDNTFESPVDNNNRHSQTFKNYKTNYSDSYGQERILNDQSRQLYHNNNNQANFAAANSQSFQTSKPAHSHYPTDYQNQEAYYSNNYQHQKESTTYSSIYNINQRPSSDSYVIRNDHTPIRKSGDNSEFANDQRVGMIADSSQKVYESNYRKDEHNLGHTPLGFKNEKPLVIVHVPDNNPIIAPNDAGTIFIELPPTISYDEALSTTTRASLLDLIKGSRTTGKSTK